MSNIVFCGVAPHPPIVLPEVGGDESKKVHKTYAAMETFAHLIADSGAEVVIIISPHGPVFRDGIAINSNPELSGDLGQFGVNLTLRYQNDLELVRNIVKASRDIGVLALEMDAETAKDYRVSSKLDHGVLVPMYFLNQQGIQLPLVSIAMSMLPFEELYSFGVALRSAVEETGRKAAIIASGDMSHRLTPEAPAGYSEKGTIFDHEIVELLKTKNFKGVINIDRNTAEEAGECGLRSIIMMLGALDGEEVESHVLSYEGPFGVGYMVAILKPIGSPKPSLREELFRERREKIETSRKGESLLVALARQTLETYVRKEQKTYPDTSNDPILQEKAGVFVSIKKHGELRGCIGTIEPTTNSIADEIVNNAISAGTADPRFEPVEPEELEDLVYSVDVLKKPEPIKNMDELDVERYGVIVRSGGRSGLLLPNLEGVNSVGQQVAIARQKAGIGSNEPVQLERFEVVRYK